MEIFQSSWSNHYVWNFYGILDFQRKFQDFQAESGQRTSLELREFLELSGQTVIGRYLLRSCVSTRRMVHGNGVVIIESWFWNNLIQKKARDFEGFEMVLEKIFRHDFDCIKFLI